MKNLTDHYRLLVFFFRRALGIYDLVVFLVLVGIDLIMKGVFSLTWPLPHLIFVSFVLVVISHAWACNDCVIKMSDEDREIVLAWLSR